jgi:hypothetical protein
MNNIYLTELPYFNKWTEKLYGYLLFLFSVFFSVFGSVQGDLPLAFKTWAIILPF